MFLVFGAMLSFAATMVSAANTFAKEASASFEGSQQALIHDTTGKSASGNIYAAKITDYNRMAYFTDIQAGYPPQTFRAVIDTSFSEVFVPSSKCETPACSAKCHQQYNSTESETYKKNGTPVSFHCGGVYTYGTKEEDTFWVAGMKIKNQGFQEATEWHSSSFFGEDKLVDSVLGLSRLPLDFPDCNLNAPGPWANVLNQNLLTNNIFSLKLSKSPHYSGEIMFGGINNDLFEGELHTIKTLDTPHNPTERLWGHGWQVQAHSLIFDDIVEDLTDHLAIFVTDEPWLQIPPALWKKLKEKCNAIEDWIGPDIVPCEKRGDLPDLIIKLGVEGEEIAVMVSGMDYVLEIEYEGYTECVLPWGAHRPWRDEDPLFIVLGTAFLGGVYSVWNQDEGNISFAKLKKETGTVLPVPQLQKRASASTSRFAFGNSTRIPTGEYFHQVSVSKK